MELKLPTATPAQTAPPPRPPNCPTPSCLGTTPTTPFTTHNPPPIQGPSMPLSSPLGRVCWKKGGARGEEVTQSRTGQNKTQLSTTQNLRNPLHSRVEAPGFPLFPSPTHFRTIFPQTGTEAGHPGSSPSPLSPLEASLTLPWTRKPAGIRVLHKDA